MEQTIFSKFLTKFKKNESKIYFLNFLQNLKKMKVKYIL